MTSVGIRDMRSIWRVSTSIHYLAGSRGRCGVSYACGQQNARKAAQSAYDVLDVARENSFMRKYTFSFLAIPLAHMQIFAPCSPFVLLCLYSSNLKHKA